MDSNQLSVPVCNLENLKCAIIDGVCTILFEVFQFAVVAWQTGRV